MPLTVTSYRPASKTVFHAGDYGAKFDGVTNDVPGILAAHDACNAAGGGEVFVTEQVTLSTLGYSASGWGAAIPVTKSNIMLVGSGVGSTVLTSTQTGAASVVDFLGYAATTAAASWASNRFPSLTMYPITGSYVTGDRTITFLNAGAAANFAAGQVVMLATGQVDIVSPAGRGLQPDSCLRVIDSVNTGANTITLARGLPKPMAQQYFTDGTTSQASTLTPSAFPAPFGVYNLSARSIKNVGAADMTIVCGATSRPALAAHAAIVGTVERVRFQSAPSGGLATWVCQEISQWTFRDITMDTWGSVGYWGLAMCTDDVTVEHQLHIHRSDVAYGLNNEGIANCRFHDIQQDSAKGATTGLASFAVGISYDCDIDGLQIHNAGPAGALQILQNQPAPFVGGAGRIRNVKMTGSIANAGYIRGNWTVKDVPQSVKLYGPPDDPSTASSGVVPSSNSTRKPKSVEPLTGVFNYNQSGGRLYLGRIPALAWIWPIEIDVTTAFTAGTTLAVSVTDPATGTDYDHQLHNNIDVTTTGVKNPAPNSTHYQQSSAIEYDVYVHVKAGTPTAGQAWIVLRWVPTERGA